MICPPKSPTDRSGMTRAECSGRAYAKTVTTDRRSRRELRRCVFMRMPNDGMAEKKYQVVK
jgi:hypothetical protein